MLEKLKEKNMALLAQDVLSSFQNVKFKKYIYITKKGLLWPFFVFKIE
jgi:hypothetical protein